MNQIPPVIHKSWHPHLQPLFDDPKMQMIKETIAVKPYFPAPENVFRVFSMPLQDIRVVVLGQDPYPKPGQATGLAFAVNEDVIMPASLRIIALEVINSNAYCDRKLGESSKWRTLEHWHSQGVFLLNTALTVEAGVAGSHMSYWNWFTRSVIETISREVTPVWMLWGAKAKAFASTIKGAETFKVNTILKAAHPAAETYSSTNEKFTGCNHFNLCNEQLELENHKAINW